MGRVLVINPVCSDYDIVCFCSSRRRHTIFKCDWSSDVCSSDLQRQRPTAAQGLVQQKVQRAEVWQFKSLHITLHYSSKEMFHAIRGDFANQNRIVPLVEGNDADV